MASLRSEEGKSGRRGPVGEHSTGWERYSESEQIGRGAKLYTHSAFIISGEGDGSRGRAMKEEQSTVLSPMLISTPYRS